MKKIALIPCVCLFPYALFAQAEAVLNPSFSAFFNSPYVQCSTLAYASLEDAVYMDASFAYPFAGGEALSAGFSSLLFVGFRQYAFNASFARNYAQRLSFAMTVNYISLSYSDAYYGKLHGLDFSLSSCFHAADPCYMSILWKNPFGLSYFAAGEKREKIPSELHFSVLYHCAEKIITYADYGQDFSSSSRVRLGADVLAFNSLRMYTQVSIPDMQLTFGIGCLGKHCQYMFHCAYSRPLGTSLGLLIVKNAIFTMEGMRIHE